MLLISGYRINVDIFCNYDSLEWTSNPSLLQSYGEQDYALREMTWPMEQAFPGLDPMTSPTVSNVTSPAETAYDASPSCEMLLTAQDVREGEAFIAEMEQKRQVSASEVCNYKLLSHYLVMVGRLRLKTAVVRKSTKA